MIQVLNIHLKQNMNNKIFYAKKCLQTIPMPNNAMVQWFKSEDKIVSLMKMAVFWGIVPCSLVGTDQDGSSP
jgi:hypothetical protein